MSDAAIAAPKDADIEGLKGSLRVSRSSPKMRAENQEGPKGGQAKRVNSR
jgi:hypothetical protein